MRTVENYIAMHRFLNNIAAKLKEQGYRISYHNHDYKFFTEIEGKTALEYLIGLPVGTRCLLKSTCTG